METGTRKCGRRHVDRRAGGHGEEDGYGYGDREGGKNGTVCGWGDAGAVEQYGGASAAVDGMEGGAKGARESSVTCMEGGV